MVESRQVSHAEFQVLYDSLQPHKGGAQLPIAYMWATHSDFLPESTEWKGEPKGFTLQ